MGHIEGYKSRCFAVEIEGELLVSEKKEKRKKNLGKVLYSIYFNEFEGTMFSRHSTS